MKNLGDRLSAHVAAGHDVRMEWQVTMRSYGSVYRRDDDNKLTVDGLGEELGDTAGYSDPWCMTCHMELYADEPVEEV